MKIGEKWAGALLALIVIFLTVVISASLIFLGSHLHAKIELTVLLYLAYTTLTMRSFGDRAYGVFQGVQKNNLSFAREELSHIISRKTEELDEAAVIRATVLAVSGNIVYGVVAPLLCLSLGGVPLAMAYKSVTTLHFIIGQKDPLYQGWGFVVARLYDWVNWLPARITGALMVIGAAFLFGTGKKTLMILVRNFLQQNSQNISIQGTIATGAMGISPMPRPPDDGRFRPLWTLPEDEVTKPQPHHIIDAIKLMGAVACVMLILCMMM